MPKDYEAMKQKFMAAGMSEKTAKSKAAAIHVGKGGTKRARSLRAKDLRNK